MISIKIRFEAMGPQGFWGSGENGYLFSGSWGALVIILGEVGSKLIILGSLVNKLQLLLLYGYRCI